MTSMDAEQRQLTQQESDLLFDELTEVRCMRARYASAFVASFGSELAEALRRVAVAGIEVQRRVAAGEMNAQRVGEIAALACSIVACAKFNALVDGVDIPIGRDASCAIVLVIVACGEIADTSTSKHQRVLLSSRRRNSTTLIGILFCIESRLSVLGKKCG